jgi:hypothetical protein
MAVVSGWLTAVINEGPSAAAPALTVRFRVHGELSELVLAGQPLERAVDGTSTLKTGRPRWIGMASDSYGVGVLSTRKEP